MSRSVLLLLNQMPQDPSSGAARNVKTQSEILASAGFRVRSLGTTATEHTLPIDSEQILREAGCEPVVRRLEWADARVFEFEHRKIHYTILDVGKSGPQAWEARHGAVFDRLLREEVTEHPADILFTYGGQRAEMRRRTFVRARGAAVVFAVLNLSYFHRPAFVDVDAVVTASEFSAGIYREKIGLMSTPLMSPFDHDDIVAEERTPRFLTYINPSLHKGVMFFARLADEIGEVRPDIPIMVIESRGTAGHLVGAGMRGGFDLRRHGNIVVSAGVSQPKHIYAATRVVVVPSVWQEPFGRVAAEAILNGIPPIVSDRGGLGEAAAGGGFVLALPESLTTKTLEPVASEDVREWRDLSIRLMTDDAFYESAAERARRAASVFASSALRAQTLGFFGRVCRMPGRTLGPFMK